MTRSALQTVKPTAIYSLAEVFEAVQKDKAAYEEQLVGAPDWAQNWPPRHCANALGRVADQLTEWKNQGVTEIISDAPFSDGAITGGTGDGITEQFRAGRVLPYQGPSLAR